MKKGLKCQNLEFLILTDLKPEVQTAYTGRLYIFPGQAIIAGPYIAKFIRYTKNTRSYYVTALTWKAQTVKLREGEELQYMCLYPPPNT